MSLLTQHKIQAGASLFSWLPCQSGACLHLSLRSALALAKSAQYASPAAAAVLRSRQGPSCLYLVAAPFCAEL